MWNAESDNLMLVLRETEGAATKLDPILVPMGPGTSILPDGRRVEHELASFSFLGDMHVRFVFDTPTFMPNLSRQQFDALGLTAEQAVELALSNVKRVYGLPTYAPWYGGVMSVSSKSPDLVSSYFLDDVFWRSLLPGSPDGLVVAVPKRGALLFTPRSNEVAVDALRRNIRHLFVSSERLRVSAALYLYKEGRWSVFEPPHRDGPNQSRGSSGP